MAIIRVNSTAPSAKKAMPRETSCEGINGLLLSAGKVDTHDAAGAFEESGEDGSSSSLGSIDVGSSVRCFSTLAWRNLRRHSASSTPRIPTSNRENMASNTRPMHAPTIAPDDVGPQAWNHNGSWVPKCKYGRWGIAPIPMLICMSIVYDVRRGQGGGQCGSVGGSRRVNCQPSPAPLRPCQRIFL